MAQLLAYQKTGTTTLTAATVEASDFLQRVKLGEWVHADFKRVRNYLFHKRFFKLLQFGFEFWTPTGGIVTPGERELLNGFVKHLIHLSGLQSSRVISKAAEEYLLLTGQQRSGDLVLLKSFEPFRAWVTVEAGFYYEAILPNGSLHRYPKSISFASMDELEFRQLYKSVFNVLWNYILFRTFRTQQEAEHAAMQLLEFA